MAFIAYVRKTFTPGAQEIIDRAVIICDEYAKKGYSLTLRQLYYVYIGNDWFPESWIDRKYNLEHKLDPDTKNTLKNYKRLGDIINDARLAGWINWDHLEDRTRRLTQWTHEENPTEAIVRLAQDYRIDMWENQEKYVQVWVEKEALQDIVERACMRLDVPYVCCRGYMSSSTIHEEAKRIAEKVEAGKEPVVIHLGDHDSSGIDMSRDNAGRLALYMTGGIDAYGSEDDENLIDYYYQTDIDNCTEQLLFRRIALTMDQVRQYRCPPNPAKETDPRAKKYVQQYGDRSWELDALKPEVLDELITNEIKSHIDMEIWNEDVERQRANLNTLQAVANRWEELEARWEEIEEFLG